MRSPAAGISDTSSAGGDGGVSSSAPATAGDIVIAIIMPDMAHANTNDGVLNVRLLENTGYGCLCSAHTTNSDRSTEMNMTDAPYSPPPIYAFGASIVNAAHNTPYDTVTPSRDSGCDNLS